MAGPTFLNKNSDEYILCIKKKINKNQGSHADNILKSLSNKGRGIAHHGDNESSMAIPFMLSDNY